MKIVEKRFVCIFCPNFERIRATQLIWSESLLLSAIFSGNRPDCGSIIIQKQITLKQNDEYKYWLVVCYLRIDTGLKESPLIERRMFSTDMLNLDIVVYIWINSGLEQNTPTLTAQFETI